MNMNGMQYPECFTTGIIDESECDLLLCAHALSAWACIMMKAPMPDCFGDVIASIANKIGVLGTAESFQEYAKEHTPKPLAAAKDAKTKPDVYNSWFFGVITALCEHGNLTGDDDSLFGVKDTLIKYFKLIIADACKDGYEITVEFKDSDSVRTIDSGNHWRVIANYSLVKSAIIKNGH